MNQWKLAARSLARRPGFSAAVVLLLTLGIGTSAALFSVVDTVLLKALPYPDSAQLVSVLEANPANLSFAVRGIRDG